MRISLAIAAAAAAGCSAGCSIVTPRSGAPAAQAMCEVALADAVMASTSAARSAAESSLSTNIAETRGYLTSQGYHRFRVAARDVRCEPYQLFPGLYRCLATAQVCGRRR